MRDCSSRIVEVETGQPIARTIAEWLARPGPDPRSHAGGATATVP